jgi:hypothetical protein
MEPIRPEDFILVRPEDFILVRPEDFILATMEPDCGCLISVCFSTDVAEVAEWADVQPSRALLVVLDPRERVGKSTHCKQHGRALSDARS